MQNSGFPLRPPALNSPGRRQFVKLAAIASVSALLSVALKSTATRAATPTNGVVRMGVVGLSFYRVVGGIVQNLLEPMGYQIEITEGTHADIFPRLGAGELDMLVAAWLPTAHQPLFEAHGGQAVELGRLYDDALFFWGVPDYLPAEVQSIADLSRPDVAATMRKLIQGIGPGAGITRLSQEVMTRYNLQAAGYEFRIGTEQEWIGAFQQGVEAEAGVIIPLWQPQYLNRAFAIRRLQDPLGVFPEPDRCALLVTQDFRDRTSTSTLDTLSRISLSVDDVTDMDYRTSVEGLSPREAATQWMEENPDAVQSWLVAAA